MLTKMKSFQFKIRFTGKFLLQTCTNGQKLSYQQEIENTHSTI